MATEVQDTTRDRRPAEEGLGQEPERFYDLLGSLTELCCVMILGSADHRGVTASEIVREFQQAVEDQKD